MKYMIENNLRRWCSTILLSLALIIVGTILLIISSHPAPALTIADADVGSVTKICELATLKCYYHNVAEYEKQPDGLFQYGIARYGYKKMWMEYEGSVKIGIRGEKIQIGMPDASGTVQIYMPDAEVLSVNVDLDSLSDPIVETGWLTWVTSDDKADAFSTAQSTMRAEAESDQSLLIRARENAKLLIEQYYNTLGQMMGKRFTIAWLQNPING